MIAITNDEGKTMYVKIREGTDTNGTIVEFIVEGHMWMWMSKADGRELRDYLGYLG